MPFIFQFFSRFLHGIVNLKWWVLVVFTLAFFAISWGLFALAGEQDLTSNLTIYLYFAATTASTVGYGDYSPQTEMGRLIAAFWFFPGSLLIFSATLGRLASGMVERIRRMADGHGNYETLAGATVIIGYNRDHTHLMIDNIIAGRDGDGKIVVLTKQTEVDLPERVLLVKSDRLDALSSLKRAAIPLAEKVMVHAESDAETFNTCLAIRELNTDLHIAAFFDDRDTARRAANLAGLEAIVSNASEALVRAAQDPGAGQILMALSAADVGATIFSATVKTECPIADLRHALETQDATLIAVSAQRYGDYTFAPFPQNLAVDGMFYYLAQNRLTAQQISRGLAQDDIKILV